MKFRMSFFPALLLLTGAAHATAQPAGGLAAREPSAAAEQRLRQDIQLVLSRLAASGALGQHPEELSLSLEEPGRRVTDLGVLVDSTSAERARDGLRVLGTTPGSAADQVGLHPGDVIVAVNGASLRQLGSDADGHALAATTLKASVASASEAEPLHLDVLRDGKLLAMNAPVQSVFVPAMRIEIGAAATVATAPAPAASSADACGRISTFDVAPRSDQQYHARILLLDGLTPGVHAHETYRVSAGQHKLLVAEDIPTRFMGAGEFPTVRARGTTSKELIVDVAAGTTVMVAAQFHQNKATDYANTGYWDPVAWRVIQESCP